MARSDQWLVCRCLLHGWLADRRRPGGARRNGGGPRHAQIPAEHAAAVEARQSAQGPFGVRAAIPVAPHGQIGQRRMRGHAFAQAARLGHLGKALPQVLAVAPVARPGRCRRATGWLQPHQPVLCVGLPDPAIGELQQVLVLKPGLVQPTRIGLARPQGAGCGTRRGHQYERHHRKRAQARLLGGQDRRHHGRGAQRQRHQRDSWAVRHGGGVAVARHAADYVGMARLAARSMVRPWHGPLKPAAAGPK